MIAIKEQVPFQVIRFFYSPAPVFGRIRISFILVLISHFFSMYDWFNLDLLETIVHTLSHIHSYTPP